MVTSRSWSDVALLTVAVGIPVSISHVFRVVNRVLAVAELARGAKPLIRMQGNQTFLDPPEGGSAQDSKRATERKTMAFSFDKSYWSAGPRDEPQYCSQQTLYDDLGKELLDHGFLGFNACILACECLVCCLLAWSDLLCVKMDKLVWRVVNPFETLLLTLCGEGSGKSYR